MPWYVQVQSVYRLKSYAGEKNVQNVTETISVALWDTCIWWL